MNFMRMAKDNLFKQISNYSLFILTIAVSTAIIFNAMNLTMNIEIMRELGEYAYMINLFSFFIVFIAVLMSSYVSYYFITSKTQEIGVIGISGGSVAHTAVYLGIQNILIEVIGAVIGIIVGLALSPLYMLLVKYNLGANVATFKVASSAIYLTIAWVVIQAMSAIVVGVGYAYKKTVRELMVEQKAVISEDKRTFKIPTFFYIIVYSLSIWFLYMIGGTTAVDVAPYISVLTVGGSLGIIKHGIPKYLDKKRKKGSLYKREKMIWTGNLAILIKKTSLLIITMMVGIIAIDSLILLNSTSSELMFMLNLELVTFLLLISLAIAYKIFAEVNLRKSEFRAILIMGYSIKQIRSTIRKEVMAFFGVIITLTLVPIATLCISSVLKGSVVVSTALGILAPTIIVMILVGIISYFGYIKIILKRI